jgi:tRNA1(Val) A37 N6-methylase TrmN6
MTQKQAVFTLMAGKVQIQRGIYNPTADAVWLAAIAPHAKTVLDVGIGTGGVSLCLLAHNPDLKITGLDISDKMLTECVNNSKLNNRDIELIQSDILTWRTARIFDLVITNPPYFQGTPAKHNAHHNADIYKWTRACLRRVKPLGHFCTIIDTAVLDKLVAALYDGKAGDIEIIPLFGTDEKTSAERTLVRAKLGGRGGTRLYSGLSMQDTRILRDGLTIRDIFTNL